MTHKTVSHGGEAQVARQTYLTRRGAVYWFRRRVPGELVPILGKSFWFDSLGTKDHREAGRRARVRAAETDREIQAATKRLNGQAAAPLTRAEAAALAQNELARWLAEDADARLAWGVDAYRNAEVVVEDFERDAREALALGDWQSVARQAHEVLCRSGRWYPEGDPSVRLMAGELLGVQVQWLDALKARQEGKAVTAPAPLAVAVAQVAVPRPVGITLGQLIDDYRRERERKYGGPSTARKYEHIFRALEAALGRERDIANIRREDIRAVRDLIERIPAHMGKRYPGLGLMAAIEAGERDGAQRLSPGTVKSYLDNLTAVFGWAVDEELLDKNPATRAAPKALPSVKRRGFEPEELELLFASLAQVDAEHAWRFWVPAMAVYSGARASELCQLRVDDVITVRGTVCLDFSVFDKEGRRDESKRLKTGSSERAVPLHRHVLNAGFEAFVEKVRASGESRLFPQLRPNKSGEYSWQLSRWFARQLDKLDMTQPSLVFHSLRHGFKDACRLAGVSQETADAIGGWASKGVSSRYGDRTRVEVLKAALEKVRFGDFVLPRWPGDA